MLFEARGVAAAYGQTLICQDVDLAIEGGEVACLLGRNGVGKTTLLRALIGMIPLSAGHVVLDGRDLARLGDHARARAGIGYVPQGRLVFPRLTVEENLRGGTLIGGSGSFAQVDEAIFDHFPILRQRLSQKAGTLSGGEQQMLAIGRALAGAPRVLLLDEPSEGIQPSIVQEIGRIIRRIARDRGLAILLVEQNLRFATATAGRGWVMDKGRIVATGAMETLVDDAVVREHLVF
jgi:branched-chain amino acid transport system ATP-binding protein